MKLDDFLKCKKVRCLDDTGVYLTENKEYQLLGVTDKYCIINDDCACKMWARIERFEPVLDSAENPMQGMELTPEFEAVEPRFKVGDKVYKYGETDVKTVLEVFEDGYMRISNYPHRVNHEVICHATPANHAMLSKPYPHIEFEQPAKELTGSDLARAMVDKGWFIVDCYVSAISDEDALRFRNKRMQVALFGDGLFTDGVKQFPFAVPFDPKTSEPLTESILND